MNTACDVSTRHETGEKAMTARGPGNAAPGTGTPPGIADPRAAGSIPTATGQGAAP